jgi:curved DNA-binding protein CbpA
VKTVRKAYRRTARECHPDKVRGTAQVVAAAEERFKEVSYILHLFY